jgi:heat shock protein HtpX
MSEPLLIRSRNIYEQQTHNRRITALLITVFVMLIVCIGVGFDVFFQVSATIRFLLLPFVLVMIGSGIWHFRERVSKGFFRPEPENIEDSDKELFSFTIRLAIISALAMLFLVTFFMMSLWPHSRIVHFEQLISFPILGYLPLGTVLSGIIGIATIGISLRWGAGSVLWSMDTIQDKNEWHDRLPELLNVAKEMSLAAGIPRPYIYTIRDKDPNAFAIGTSPSESSIVVTTGLLDTLDREELQAVIAHEIAHIRNYDTRLMTTITILFGAVVLISEWMRKCALYGSFLGGRIPGTGWVLRGFFFVAWLSTLILAPLLARIIAMAVSRQREYLADACGAELTRNPQALVGALTKIVRATDPTFSFNKGVAHLCIVDPMGRKVNSKEGWWADLLATHPPMKNRIMLLNAMGYKTIA